METTPKQLIIDKDVFQAAQTPELKKFARTHFLILPEVLLYECLTTDRDKDILLERFRQVMLVGGYICPPIKMIVRKEAENLTLYGYLPDLQMSLDMRKDIRKKSISFASNHVSTICEEHFEAAQSLLNSAKSTSTTLLDERPDVVKKARGYQADRFKRFELWIETVRANNIHELVIDKLGYLTNSPGKFCLSDDWVSWHYFCIVASVYMEHIFQAIVNERSFDLTSTEHDCEDAKYISYLSRADGILTNDKRLVQPLSQAAFPGKDIFSSLDEVLCYINRGSKSKKLWIPAFAGMTLKE